MRPEHRQPTVTPLAFPEIVRFPAEIDLTNARRYGSELLAALRPGVTVVIADLSQTEYCDSSGVRYLLIGNDAARHHGAELHVVVATPAVQRVMTVLGVDRMLSIYSSMADAMSDPSPRTRTG